MPKYGADFMTRNELAELLECTTKTVDRMVAAGSIPFVRVRTFTGRKTRVQFERAKIDAWLKARIAITNN